MAEEAQSGRRSIRRKLLEQFMAVVLETRATKEEILELYLNEVYLGHRGSFALHGVAAAARTYFAKDLSNLTVAEGALIAGVIQSPGNHSPFASLTRAKERRDVVLQAMHDAGYLTAPALDTARAEPLQAAARALDFEAPYFVDYVADALDAALPGLVGRDTTLEVYTTLDINLQRAAQDAVRTGLAAVDDTLAKRKRAVRPQAALIAVDPRTGEVLALVGGRSYNQSQFNRVTGARRQPGSVFKPFVYLAAFDQAAHDGRTDVTPATLVLDEPTTWPAAEGDWTPSNYDDEYDGMITLRRALALSRNIAAIKVAEQAGFSTVASMWTRTGLGKTPLRGYPSIALGVFELTPFEVAEAFTTFATLGTQRPLRAITRVVSGRDDRALPAKKSRTDRRPGRDLPRDQHDAQRAQRGHGGLCPRRRIRARRRRQDRHDQRPARCLVRGLYTGTARRRLGGARRQPDPRPERRPIGAADLDGIHEAGARRATERALHPAPGHRSAGDRPRYRPPRPAGLPTGDHRGLPRRYRTGNVVPAAPVSVIIGAHR